MSHFLNLTLTAFVAGTFGLLVGSVGAFALMVTGNEVALGLKDEKNAEEQIAEAMRLANNLNK